MKKLYRKSSVHPTPSAVSEHLLSFLPAAILSLTVALSPAEREVVAYLVSSSSSSHRKSFQSDDHAACFNCNCFRCYMAYWAKWDSSPNRQLIHEVIDAFEDTLSNKEKNRKYKRKAKNLKPNILNDPTKCSEVIAESNTVADSGGGREEADNADEDYEFDKGSVRRFVSFLGESIWSVWC